MAQQITYNSKTITFPVDHLERLAQEPQRMALSSASLSRIVETLNVAIDCRITAAFRYFNDLETTHQTLRRNLLQWHAWASLGNAWTFAYDSDDAVLTTLAAGANAGASEVEVSSATGIVVGGEYVIRSATSFEVVRASAVNGTTLTLQETLNAAFADGDRFRSLRYWPARLVDLARSPIVERPPVLWGLQLEFMEDLNP